MSKPTEESKSRASASDTNAQLYPRESKPYNFALPGEKELASKEESKDCSPKSLSKRK